MPSLSITSETHVPAQQAESCPRAAGCPRGTPSRLHVTSTARPTASLPPDVANHRIWPPRSAHLTGASAASVLTSSESGNKLLAFPGRTIACGSAGMRGGVYRPVLGSGMWRRRGEGCSPREMSGGACCIPVFTVPVLPPPQLGQLSGPAPSPVTGPLGVPGSR